ncbi:MAG: helix-turn-helix domain-containing protein, partial [Dehalococcoidia bacterium]|nr:helix-turn-helix domain-containing protein [Dehalococcoidia bacterium]
MSAAEKAEVLTKVASSPLPKRKTLRELGIPKSTYYRWLRRKDHQRLEDHAGSGKPTLSDFMSCFDHYWEDLVERPPL